MKASELIKNLESLIAQFGDAEVHAFPGWDTSYPVSPETIDYYTGDITGGEPYILITGQAPE